MVQCVCRADHDRITSQVEKQRQRADRAERALEPLRHNIRQLTAEVEAKGEEIRVVRDLATLLALPAYMLLQCAAFQDVQMWAVPWKLSYPIW